jgi:segregation and condensation protein B
VYDDPLDEATQGLRAHEARRVVEAVVMAATDPVEPTFLAQLVELPVASIEELCRALAAEYDDAGRGFVLVKVAGGYRYQTHPELSPYVERFVLEGQHSRLSAPAFETLAIVAYKQPIRADLRHCGVDVESVLSTSCGGYIERSARPRTGAGCDVRDDASSSNDSASTRSPTCRRSVTSCLLPTSSTRSSAVCAVRRPAPNP